MSESLCDIPLRNISGKSTSFAAFRGKVLLAVNVASKCGLAPQYTALEAHSSGHRPGACQTGKSMKLPCVQRS